MFTTTLAYATVEKRLPTQLQLVERNPVNQREIAYFRENIGKVKTADDLVDDPRLFRFAITAFDLESQANSQAIFKKIMTEGFDDQRAIVNRLRNAKFTAFAAVWQFPGEGEKTVRDQRLIDGIVERYKRIRLEQREGEQNPGVRLALYFDRSIDQVNSYFGILADRPMREFVFTALNLPDAMQTLEPDRLVKILEDRFDLDQLKTEAGKADMIRRFNAIYDARNPVVAATAPIAALFQPIGFGAPPIASIDASALFALRTSG